MIAEVDSGQAVLITGAGPVGLFVSILLARAGIKVEIFERLTDLRPEPRAAGHYGPDLEVMKKAGVYELLKAEANMQTGIGWRARPIDNGRGGKTFGKAIAWIPDLQLIIPQSKLARIVAKEALATGLVTIHWGKELVGVRQDTSSVTVTVKDIHTGAMSNIQGPYLIGCDGGRSTVRSLIGIRFPGHTWPDTVVATDVLVKNDEVAPIQPHFVVHPVNYAVVIPLEPAKEGRRTLWRYAFAVSPEQGKTDEELLDPKLIHQFYETIMAGQRPLDYEIRQKAVYRTHQRLAQTMKRGRVLLAGDAAHLCSPIGGMGLTTGILDAEAVADAFTMVLKEGYSSAILDLYSDLRRQAFGLFVDPMSTMNRSRVSSEPEEIENENFLVRLLNSGDNSGLETLGQRYQSQWRTDIRAVAAKLNIGL